LSYRVIESGALLRQGLGINGPDLGLAGARPSMLYCHSEQGERPLKNAEHYAKCPVRSSPPRDLSPASRLSITAGLGQRQSYDGLAPSGLSSYQGLHRSIPCSHGRD
jgi:hypothetical protein